MKFVSDYYYTCMCCDVHEKKKKKRISPEFEGAFSPTHALRSSLKKLFVTVFVLFVVG